jgi:hypothetical protein
MATASMQNNNNNNKLTASQKTNTGLGPRKGLSYDEMKLQRIHNLYFKDVRSSNNLVAMPRILRYLKHFILHTINDIRYIV